MLRFKSLDLISEKDLRQYFLYIKNVKKYALMPAGVGQESDADGRVGKDILQFKLAGKPGVKAQFILSRGQVERVTYLEDKPGKMVFAIGTLKP